MWLPAVPRYESSSAQRTLLPMNERQALIQSGVCSQKMNSLVLAESSTELDQNIAKWCVSSDIGTKEPMSCPPRYRRLYRIFGARSGSSEWGSLTSTRASRATILLVEDEVLVRMSLAGQLRCAGYVVLEASNADEALDILQSWRVRIVLSDIRMPGRFDGVELAHAIRAKHPDVKILLASAQSFSAGHWYDYDGFFPKPYDARRLIEHIKILLG
jgi:CheY-like chemotaxis protein